ncbi:hypothetical protein [Actinokineospora diospyrosa]|uniref:PPM-type phosphatase domain-containing protein n=1 Tax=Actinokineospora diospyrosa TaxID=103728 RepID=A0ABT1I5J5_9PSEU|nr:hypothetical protein [Actinokineospora diospyrosa]MCP2267900.1 hypothetical protein [Actinokineospora diospyrosa]
MILTAAIATRLGGKPTNADAAAVHHLPDGRFGAALVDGIGSDPVVVDTAVLAAQVAARVGSHRQALTGLLAAADLYPHPAGPPDAVGAVVTVDHEGRIDIAHVGDAAVHTWRPDTGLTHWTPAHTVGSQASHMGLAPGPVLDQLDDYVLTTLVGATATTVATGLIPATDPTPHHVLLTSDGVHKTLTTAEITEKVHLLGADPQATANRLVDDAIRVAGHHADNTTAIVIRIDFGNTTG